MCLRGLRPPVVTEGPKVTCGPTEAIGEDAAVGAVCAWLLNTLLASEGDVYASRIGPTFCVGGWPPD